MKKSIRILCVCLTVLLVSAAIVLPVNKAEAKACNVVTNESIAMPTVPASKLVRDVITVVGMASGGTAGMVLGAAAIVVNFVAAYGH